MGGDVIGVFSAENEKLNAPESISRVIICRRAEKAEPLQKTTNKKKKGAGEEVNRMARWCMKVEKAS